MPKRSAYYYKIEKYSSSLDYHKPISEENIEAVEKLLSKPESAPRLLENNAQGLTPLAAAVLLNQCEIVKLLAESNLEIAINEEFNELGGTALSYAMRNKNYEMVSALVQHKDLEIMEYRNVPNFRDKQSKMAEEILLNDSYYEKFDQAKVNLVVDIVNHQNFDEGYLQDFFGSRWSISESFMIAYINHPDAIVAPEFGKPLLFEHIFIQSKHEDIIGALVRSDKDIGIDWTSDGLNVLSYAMESYAFGHLDGDKRGRNNIITIINKLLDSEDLDLSTNSHRKNYNNFKYFSHQFFYTDDDELEVYKSDGATYVEKHCKNIISTVEKYINHPNLELEHCSIPDFISLIGKFENFKKIIFDTLKFSITQDIKPLLQPALQIMLDKGARIFVENSKENPLVIAGEFDSKNILEILLKNCEDKVFFQAGSANGQSHELKDAFTNTRTAFLEEDNDEAFDIFLSNIALRAANYIPPMADDPPMALQDGQILAVEPELMGLMPREYA